MSSLGTTTIYGDLQVTGHFKADTTDLKITDADTVDGKHASDFIGTNGGTMTGNLTIKSASPTALTLLPTNNVENQGAQIVFGSTDNQHVRIRANHYDNIRAPFGFHIEKCEPNTQTGKAYLEVEGDIFAQGTHKVFHPGNLPDITQINNNWKIFNKKLGSTADLNTIVVPGIYDSDSDGGTATILNKPPGAIGFVLHVYEGFTGRIFQFLMSRNSQLFFRARDENNKWAIWTKLDTNCLPLSGGTLTGNINLNIGGRNGYLFKFVAGDANGSAVGIGAGGLTVLGSGESTNTYLNALPSGVTPATEKLVLLSDSDIDIYTNAQSGLASAKKITINNGEIRATKVYNAVWNDYAEYFEKKDLEETFEPGDVIASIDDKYVKSTSAYQESIIGVFSDTFGHIVGGVGDIEEDNKNCVPVGLAGRVKVKVVGKVKNGQLLTSSNIPGVAMYASEYKPGTIIGKAVEDKDTEEVGKVKMLIMNI